MILIVLSLVFMTISSSGYEDTIFWNNLSERNMLNIIKSAENLLKIFIYDIPDIALFNESREDHLKQHFQSEYV